MYGSWHFTIIMAIIVVAQDYEVVKIFCLIDGTVICVIKYM